MLAVSYLCTSGSLSTRQVLSACHWMEYVPQWFSMNYLNWSTSIAHGGNQKRYAAHKQGFALTLSLTHNACFGAPSRWWYLAQPNQNAARWLQAMSTSDIMANQNDNALTMLDNGKNLFGIVWTLTCRWFLFTTFFAPRWKGMPAEAESLHRICLVVPLLALFWTQKHFRESTPRKWPIIRAFNPRWWSSMIHEITL